MRFEQMSVADIAEQLASDYPELTSDELLEVALQTKLSAMSYWHTFN